MDFTGLRPKDDGPPRIVPATPFDLEQLDRMRRGKLALVSVSFPRSIEALRWYWALVGVVAQAIGEHPNSLHANIKFKAKLIRNIFLAENGQPIVELRSIAIRKPRAELDEIEFTEFRSMAVTIIFRDYLSGVRKKDVWKKVEALVGPCPW